MASTYQDNIDQTLRESKEQFRVDLHRLKMLGSIYEKRSIPIQEYISMYDVESEYEEILHKEVIGLTSHERVICLLYWLKNGKILG